MHTPNLALRGTGKGKVVSVSLDGDNKDTLQSATYMCVTQEGWDGEGTLMAPEGLASYELGIPRST